jgi:peptide methionine sulfoxide reductase MsrB
VEIDQVGPLQERLLGAELRCQTCGGHLGDVFNDGYLFPGTPAFVTGKRYCIDGAALIFYPQQGGDEVRGDTPRPKTLPNWLKPPEIHSI